MMRYPVLSQASTIPCPRHRINVAVGEDGRLTSTCCRCVREATVAVSRLRTIARRREAVT